LEQLVGRYFGFPDLDLSEHEVLRAVVAELPVALSAVDIKGNVMLWNQAAARLWGWSEEEVLGHLLPTVSRAQEQEFHRLLRRTIATGEGVQELETERQHRNGDQIPILLSTAALRDHRGMVAGDIATYLDLRARKHVESQLRHQAHRDELTGLYNRRGFVERLQQLLTEPHRNTAIISLDLDDFKSVNDTLGHPVGDQLLTAFAKRLQAAARPTDLVARVGGDEFMVVLSGILGDALEPTARRLFDRLGQNYVIDGRELVTGVSGGVAICPKGGDADSAVRQADVALYHAKQVTRGHFQVIDQGMRRAFLRRVELAGHLAGAVERGEFRLHFQPLVKAGSDRMTGIEALVRWARPKRKLVLPDQFIALAEQTGSITEIGRWMLEQACRTLRSWDEIDPLAKVLKVSVNLSGVELRAQQLPAHVEEILNRYQLAPDRLCLEVTESALSSDPEAGASVLEKLRSLGVHLAMDNFGTGDSSLTALRRFPFDILKIDRTLVGGIGASQADSALVAATIALARALGLRTVAEGVETQTQANFLVDNGCDELQGHLFGRPVPFARLPSPSQPALPVPQQVALP
jgi:diguanylate cyclase (GGDEF)-like protein/PAS domain S-box-containing protein